MREKNGIINNNRLLWGIAALSAGAGCACLPKLLPMGGRELIYTNSIAAFFLFLIILGVLHRALAVFWQDGKKRVLPAACVSFLFSLCMAFGATLEEAENVVFTDFALWLAIFVWGAIFTLLTAWAWRSLGNGRHIENTEGFYGERGILPEAEGSGERGILPEAEGSGQQGSADKGVKSNLRERLSKLHQLSGFHQLLIVAGLLFLCWFPVFLGVFPGFFVYDATDEWVQAVTGQYTAHHPLAHVYFMGLVIRLVNKVSGSYNWGIAAYTLVQMGILAMIFSAAVLYLKRKKISFPARAATVLYLGFFPVIVMFSLCSAKDGLFAGLLLLLFLAVREGCERPELFLSSWKKQTLFVVAAVGMMLLRHNGRYAFGVMALFLLIFGRQRWKKILCLAAVSLLLYLFVNSGLSLRLRAEPGGRQELLTVPIQQLARVYGSEKENLNPAELAELYEFIPETALEHYVPKVSDGVKVAFNNQAFAAEPGKFLRLWVKWGLAHPFTYLNAWLLTSYGFWYPDTVIDVYRGNEVFTFTYEDSSYFGYEVEHPGVRESKIPWLAEFYRKLSLEITQQKLPVVSMLFSPGFLFWVMAFTMGYLWERKNYRRLTPWLLPFLVWLTFLLGPTYLVRYVVFLWFLLPFMLADCGKNKREIISSK